MLTDKDQEAIAHIASVSEHPHAAMIAEWLITGCEVRAKMSQEILEPPSWFKDISYELVYQKIKPAYRVYRYKGDSVTYTQDRSTDGTESTLDFPHDTEFLSGWIEYDPEPNKWPTPLVERIADIDIKAAEWIVDNWDDLLESRYTNKGNYSRENEQLVIMFDWSKSDQGFQYWNEIDLILK